MASSKDPGVPYDDTWGGKPAQQPAFLDSTGRERNLFTELIPGAVPNNRLGTGNQNSWVFWAGSKAWSHAAHSAGTVYRVATPYDEASHEQIIEHRLARGLITDDAADGETAQALLAEALLAPDDSVTGHWELAAIYGAWTDRKIVVLDWEPHHLLPPTGIERDITRRYPYHMVRTREGAYGCHNYQPMLPPTPLFDPKNPEHQARLDLVQRMHQNTANVFVPFVVDRVLDPGHPAFGARPGLYEWVLTFEWEMRFQNHKQTLQSTGVEAVQNWIDRTDAVLNLTVQFPPSEEYMDGEWKDTFNGPNIAAGPYYVIPPRKTVADYAQYNNLGPGDSPTRLADLVKHANGHIHLGFYLPSYRTAGHAPDDGEWSAALLRGCRRMMEYAASRKVPVLPYLWSRPYDLASEDRINPPKILRALIQEFRFRYDHEWAVFARPADRDTRHHQEMVALLKAELAKPVIPNLENDHPQSGWVGYDPDTIWPDGVTL